MLLISLYVFGVRAGDSKQEVFLSYNNAYSRFSCFPYLGSLDSRLRGNDRHIIEVLPLNQIFRASLI